MKIKIIPFWEKLQYSLIVILIGLPATIGWLYLLTTDQRRGRGYTPPTFAHGVAFYACLFIILIVAFRGALLKHITIENDYVTVWYFALPRTFKKGAYNIDSKWNSEIYLSEVKNVEIVKLTKEERRTKVFYRHLFNKYLKIDLKYGKTKYVYVGNCSRRQIDRIIALLS